MVIDPGPADYIFDSTGLVNLETKAYISEGQSLIWASYRRSLSAGRDIPKAQ